MKCHGNLNSRKMGYLSGQTRLLEDIAVDTFVHSSFGTVVMSLFQGLFTGPSWHTFLSTEGRSHRSSFTRSCLENPQLRMQR